MARHSATHRASLGALCVGLVGIIGQVTAQVSLISPGIEERAALAGESYSGVIVVRNLTGTTQEVVIYQTDYRFNAYGGTWYDEPGTQPRSNAAWISFSPTRAVVAPGSTEAISYTVAVPGAGPGLAGTYWSIVMVEGVPLDTAAVAVATARHIQVGIASQVRYAIQIATHLPGGATAVDLADPDFSVGSAGQVFAISVSNSGARAYRPDVRLELYDERGNRVAAFTNRRGLLYPGTSLRQLFELERLAPGTYKALVIVDPGADEVVGAQYTIRPQS